MKGRVLIVAGSDSGGGAGIQADIKAVLALGAHASTAITALTAQNTMGVHGVHPTPPAFVRQQMEAVLTDIGADVVKTGMLGNAETIEVVADVLCGLGLPLVLDPVMVAKGGARLLDPAALASLKSRLLPLATVVTPNVPEAEDLLGRPIPDFEAATGAAKALMDLGAPAVLLKGGHFSGPAAKDVLVAPGMVEVFENPRIETRHTHGTGCTLASAIAAGLAQGLGLFAAVVRARAYVQAAIESAPGLGKGHGPLDHGVTIDPGRLRGLSPPDVAHVG